MDGPKVPPKGRIQSARDSQPTTEPKITAIKQQVKNPARVSVFLDEKYSFSLTLDQLLQEKLKKGQAIDTIRLDQLKKLSDEGKLKVKALDWLMMRPHSTREFRDYGYRKKIDKDLVEQLVEEFTAKKYINDEYFAQWFAENRLRKNKSKRSVVSELMSKGIQLDIATRVVDELADDDDALKQLVEKLQSRSRYKDEQKLIAYLISKGFRYDAIRQVLQDRSDG